MSSVIHFYEVYGLTIASEIEFIELRPSVETGSFDLTISKADLGVQPDELQQYSFSEGRQIMILPMVGSFVLLGTDTILVEPKKGVSDDLLAVALLGPVLAIALYLRGRFLLHGSAIVSGGVAYGFVGDKGAGKSTLATMLLKNRDVELLTDDLLVVTDQLQVLRGYPQVKLSNEALSFADQSIGTVRPPPINAFPKNQFLLETISSRSSVPIGGIFELRRSNNTRIECISTAEALRVLLRFSYVSRFSDLEMSIEQKGRMFQSTTSIANSGKVKRLFVPDQIGKLDQVIELLQSNSE